MDPWIRLPEPEVGHVDFAAAKYVEHNNCPSVQDISFMGDGASPSTTFSRQSGIPALRPSTPSCLSERRMTICSRHGCRQR
jgi:hypothetical protein